MRSPKPSHFLDDTSDDSFSISSDGHVNQVVDTGVVSMADVPSSEISSFSPTHKRTTSTQSLKAPPTYKLPPRAYYETDSDENANERKCEARPQDPFVTKMSVHLARLAPNATYKPVRVEYPQVDFFQLNQRFIGNIPKPFSPHSGVQQGDVTPKRGGGGGGKCPKHVRTHAILPVIKLGVSNLHVNSFFGV